MYAEAPDSFAHNIEDVSLKFGTLHFLESV